MLPPLSHFWLSGSKIWQTFGSLCPKFSTPLTLLAFLVTLLQSSSFPPPIMLLFSSYIAPIILPPSSDHPPTLLLPSSNTERNKETPKVCQWITTPHHTFGSLGPKFATPVTFLNPETNICPKFSTPITLLAFLVTLLQSSSFPPPIMLLFSSYIAPIILPPSSDHPPTLLLPSSNTERNKETPKVCQWITTPHHTFGSLGPKFATPVTFLNPETNICPKLTTPITLLALWVQNCERVANFGLKK